MSTRSRIEVESHKDPQTLEREIDAKRAEISGTVAALENKLSPGEIFERVWGSARGSDLADNLAASLKANPLPLMLTGVGIAWMMYNQQRGPAASRYYYYEDEYVTDEDVVVGGYVEGSYASDANRGPGIGEKASEKAGELRDRASGKLHSARDKLGEAGHSISERGHQAGESMRRKAHDASDAVHRAGRSVRRRAHNAGDAMHRAGDSVRYQAHQAREGMDSMLREQPLAVGAIGIAIGALFGAMLPPTQREDELMGATADRARDTARERAEELASSGLDKAEEKLSQQGSNGQATRSGDGGSSASPSL